MNSPKLLEAIAELEAQRSVIDDAITHLKRAHATLAGSNLNVSEESTTTTRRRRTPSGSSYVDMAVDAIKAADKALHISDILSVIKHSGKDAGRASVESSLLREMQFAKKAGRQPRIVRTGPSTFDIPRSFAIAS